MAGNQPKTPTGSTQETAASVAVLLADGAARHAEKGHWRGVERLARQLLRLAVEQLRVVEAPK